MRNLEITQAIKNRDWSALSALDLKNQNLSYLTFKGAALNNLDFSGTNLEGANLEGANLIGANLIRANLVRANLKGADLRGADLKGANLIRANLRDANFTNANLKCADLRCANFTNAVLTNATFENNSYHDTIGNGREIVTLLLKKYTVVIVDKDMQIGCKKYTIDEWNNFSDDEIDKMDYGALEWWKINKNIIFDVIKKR